jgi:hypothetical protein
MTEWIILEDYEYDVVYMETESKYIEDKEEYVKNVAKWEGIDPSQIICKTVWR